MHGYSLGGDGEQLAVDLVWRSILETDTFYTVFIHVVDETTGEIVAQRDWIPANGVRPTIGWRPDEYILDEHLLDVSQLPSGSYLVRAGLSTPQTFERPFVMLNGEELPNSQVELGTIESNVPVSVVFSKISQNHADFFLRWSITKIFRDRVHTGN